jgi:hypothetical protein
MAGSNRVMGFKKGPGVLMTVDEAARELVFTAKDQTASVLAALESETQAREEADAGLQESIGEKVDKISGKGLSSNDFTNADKVKLDGVDEDANNYTHPSATARTSGLYKITVNDLGHVTDVVAAVKTDITALGIPGTDTDTTYSEATDSAAGLMSAEDKVKLDETAEALEGLELSFISSIKVDGTAIWPEQQ